MLSYTYPANDLDDRDALAALLGSFWSESYAANDEVLAFCGAVGRVAAQAANDVDEAGRCLSRADVPVYHVEEWQVAYVLRSRALAASSVPGFGAGSLLGGGTTFGYVIADDHTLPIPGLVSVPWVFNRVTDPSVSLCEGVDYLVSGDSIVFRDDPFENPLFATRAVFDDAGNQVDAEIALWLFRANHDKAHVFRHFGYVVGLDAPSSPAYKALVGSVLDAVVGGSPSAATRAVLSAATGVPFAGGDEVVEAVAYDSRGLLVCTDRAAYRLPAGSSPVVASGDRVSQGDTLCDAVEVIEANLGWASPGVRALDSLSADVGFLEPGFYGELVFQNRDVPLVVAADPFGVTRASFALGGFPADADEFWDRVHARGVAAGVTLANLLDTRDVKVGQPTAASLPATINPLRFLADNVLRGGAFVVKIKADGLPQGVGLAATQAMRKVTNPGTYALFLVQAPPLADDVVDEDYVGGSTVVNAGADPVTESDEPTPSADGPVTARATRWVLA